MKVFKFISKVYFFLGLDRGRGVIICFFCIVKFSFIGWLVFYLFLILVAVRFVIFCCL